MFHIIYFEPEIPGNTGAAIRLSACTGAHLHLVEPLGFNFDDKHLKRAGLDYHDLANVTVHKNFDELLEPLEDTRIFAFTGHTENNYADENYREGDAFLFGRESTGLPLHILNHPAIYKAVRIPMQPHRRSLNLANSTAIALYKAWEQHGFAGSAPFS
ncbi:MAG: tRNA (cytidine(34)-2'-O)-methyltransferase [Actinomycetaceae bacterium]|nr:tRNA (cytidine(34)-2'-O)-methyltransferase [Actinomycetaceae bacterium]